MGNPVRAMYFALLKQGKTKKEARALVAKKFKLKERRGGKSTAMAEFSGMHFRAGERPYGSGSVSGGKVKRKTKLVRDSQELGIHSRDEERYTFGRKRK